MTVVEVRLIDHARYTGIINYNGRLLLVSLQWLTHKIGNIYYIAYDKVIQLY